MMVSSAEKSMCYIGVTGTNGKTSCAWWLAQLLQELGKKLGLIGTLGCGVWEKGKPVDMRETGYTTPDAKLLQKILADFIQQGVTHVVMEVSSHGLVQGRADTVAFSTALFTNLSRDHLDYHGTMEKYGAAKLRLFKLADLQHAVVNIDDAFGQTIVEQCSAPRVFTYSIRNSIADIFMRDVEITHHGISGKLITPWGERFLISPVIGEFNVLNLLGVIGVLCAEGFDFIRVVESVKNLQAPPGRLQRVSLETNAADISVFVDFAHTPDALEKILITLRSQTTGQLWCVFGCGGDRDSGKRPEMGEIASRLADHAVVTSDNPRSENPQHIINEILLHMNQGKTIAIQDRKKAIQHAISSAKPNDIVLIAGKGHEAYQEIQGVRIPFSDVDVAFTSLKESRA